MNHTSLVRSPLSRALFALAVVFATSCRGCGAGGETASLLSLASPEAKIAVSTGDLTENAIAARAFFTAATKRGMPMAANLEAAAKVQVGFDPFLPSAYKEVGLDPKPGLVMFAEGDVDAVIVAMRVADQKKAAQWLLSTIKRTEGASDTQSKKVDGVELTVAGRPFGTEFVPVSTWTFVKSHVLIAPPNAEASLVAAAKRLSQGTAKKTLLDDPLYMELAGKVPKTSMVRVFARGDAVSGFAQAKAEDLPRGAMLALSYGETGLSGDLYLSIDVGDLSKVISGPPTAPLASKVGADAVLVMMTQAARAGGLAAARKNESLAEPLNIALAQFEQETGLNAEETLMPLLGGPLTAGVYLQDAQRALGAIQLGLRDPNAMLDFVHVSVTAEIKEPAKMAALLDEAKGKIETSYLKFNKTESDRNGKKLVRYEPDRPQPRLGWALYGDTYVYGAGSGRLDQMLDVLDGKSPSLSLKDGPGFELANRKGATLVVLRVGEIGTKVESIASTIGGGAAMVGQLVSSAVEVAKTVGDVAVSVEADAGGVRVSMREVLR